MPPAAGKAAPTPRSSGRRPFAPTAPQDSNAYGYGVSAGAYAYGIGTARRGNLPIPGSPAGLPIGSNGFPSGDLARAASGEPPMISGNGFPSAGGAPALATGANGYPVAPGSPGAAPLPVGPNGFPVPAASGSPGTAAPLVGPNGFPAAAPPANSSSPPSRR